MLLAALVLYTVALAVAVTDDVLHLGLFPTEMERQARALIAEFDDPDPGVRSAAVERLFREIEGFVAVPELIRALGSPSPPRRAVANDGLKRLTGSDQGFDPNGSPADRKAAIARWRAWWEANPRRF
jgi:HEAT repeat protein